MKLHRRSANPFAGLNITPLIDVVFMLLVFFMLATNFARYRLIGVDSPDKRPVAAISEGAVVILLAGDGVVEVDNVRYPRDQLGAAVASILAIDPHRDFLLRPVPGIPLQEAVTAYDEARAAGARRLSFSRWREAG